MKQLTDVRVYIISALLDKKDFCAECCFAYVYETKRDYFWKRG